MALRTTALGLLVLMFLFSTIFFVHAQTNRRNRHSSNAQVAKQTADKRTIAEELLAMETNDRDYVELATRLGHFLDVVTVRFVKLHKGESEAAKARRFFTTVDAVLIEQNFVFPPRGLIDLLRNALTPRTLTMEEHKMVLEESSNIRRRQQIQHNFLQNGKFYFVDCDLSAIMYKAAGEKIGLPIEFVEVPKHNFVRWSSPTLKMNWDTNEGATYTDNEYARDWGVTNTGRKHLGWLENMPRTQIRSYWWGLIGRWHKRHGRYQEALSAFRAGVKVDSQDLSAANELAWFLATSPDSNLRNGREAETIAKKVVAIAPRANWLDTLAAAQAEKGDYNAAEKTELKAKEVATTTEWGISSADSVADLDKCIAAYRKKLTYRQAVNQGLIEDPVELLPYD